MSIRNTALAASLSMIALLAGCSSPSVITEKDGSTTTTKDKPTYNKSTGFYEYQKDGKTVQINKDDVHGIEQVK
jgi:peptidase E